MLINILSLTRTQVPQRVAGLARGSGRNRGRHSRMSNDADATASRLLTGVSLFSGAA